MPRLYSAGLYCDYDHRHHAYWRFDFDIDNAANDQVLEYNTYTANNGWGVGWHPKTFEATRTKNPASQRSWAVLDAASGRGYHVLPGAADGPADAFSTSDLWVLRYRGTEGPQRTAGLSRHRRVEPLPQRRGRGCQGRRGLVLRSPIAPSPSRWRRLAFRRPEPCALRTMVIAEPTQPTESNAEDWLRLVPPAPPAWVAAGRATCRRTVTGLLGTACIIPTPAQATALRHG
jgi:hypothetical protein